MKYVYTAAAALLIGLIAGFYLWYQRPPSGDRVAGILIGTPHGRLDLDTVERVRAREGQSVLFVVVNASDLPRTVTLGFFRGQTPVNVCTTDILPFPLAAQAFHTVSCEVGRGLVERFPVDGTLEDERADPNARVFDYRTSFDGQTHYDARLIVER